MDGRWDQFGADYDHPPFAGKPYVYMIASTPRSGSHYLGHLLLETGALGSPLEYIHPVHGKKWMELLGAQDMPSMLTQLYRRRTSPSGWFGLKAHWVHFKRIAANERALRFFDIQAYIHIRRRDTIAQAISYAIANQTQSWISFHDAQMEPRYDFAEIHAAAEQIRANDAEWETFFQANSITPLRIFYEDLIADPAGTTDRVLAHCGVTRVGGEPRWQPQRQASAINASWHERYLSDLAATTA